MIFESHAHYDDERFDGDREELLKVLPDSNIGIVVNAGASIATSLKAIQLAEEYPYIYAAAGVHPHDVGGMKEKDLETLIALAANRKTVAIGEIGLDYYYDNVPPEIQKLWFREQLNVAGELAMPVIIHSREASKDTYDILYEANAHKNGGVIHCYSGSAETAKRYVKLGYYLGIGGVVTFKNARKLVETVKEIPLEHLLVETDCPYLAPIPHRGKRNDSRYLKHIIEAIAEIKGVSPQLVEQITWDNGMKLFDIR